MQQFRLEVADMQQTVTSVGAAAIERAQALGAEATAKSDRGIKQCEAAVASLQEKVVAVTTDQVCPIVVLGCGFGSVCHH